MNFDRALAHFLSRTRSTSADRAILKVELSLTTEGWQKIWITSWWIHDPDLSQVLVPSLYGALRWATSTIVVEIRAGAWISHPVHADLVTNSLQACISSLTSVPNRVIVEVYSSLIDCWAVHSPNSWDLLGRSLLSLCLFFSIHTQYLVRFAEIALPLIIQLNRELKLKCSGKLCKKTLTYLSFSKLTIPKFIFFYFVFYH